MMAKILLVGVALLFIFSPVGEAATTFRCGHHLIQVGETSLEVLNKCGEPTLKEVVGTGIVGASRVERGIAEDEMDLRSRRRYTELSLVIERWYYDCGSHRFIKILTFQGGILKHIRMGGYGSGKSDCLGATQGEADKQAEERPKDVEEGYGRIIVSGAPYGAKVLVDHQYMGNIPCTLDQMPTGPHTVVVKEGGYKDQAKRVIVKAKRTFYLSVYLEPEKGPEKDEESLPSNTHIPSRIYKWTDEEGNVHIMDRPPHENESE